MKKTFLQTKDAGRLLDVTPDGIRKMERRGLLNAERTESGTRLFDRREVEKLAKERAKKKNEGS